MRPGWLVAKARGLCHRAVPESETSYYKANDTGNSAGMKSYFERKLCRHSLFELCVTTPLLQKRDGKDVADISWEDKY